MHHAWRTPHSAVLALLAWLAGLAALQQCARLPEASELAALLLLLAAGLAARPAACAEPGPAGFRPGRLAGPQRLDQALPAAREGRDLLLSGRIASLTQAVQGQGGLRGRRFVFMARAGRGPAA